MEKDKSLLTLAVAGVGLLVTLLTAVGVRSWTESIFYACGFYGFGRTAWIAIRIFDCNADYLEKLATNQDVAETTLKDLDKGLVRHFLVGVLAAVMIGASAAYFRFLEGDSTMAEQDNKTQQSIRGVEQIPSGLGDSIRGSVDGFIKLKPAETPTTTPTTSEQSGTNKPPSPEK